MSDPKQTVDPPEKPTWTITETALIALAAPLSYGLAYLFEVGYADYYRIPTLLISVSLENVVRAATALVFVVVGTLTTTNLAMVILPDKARAREWWLLWLLGILLLMMLQVTRSIFDSVFLAVALVVAVLAFLFYVTPALTRWHVPYRERLRESFAAEAQTDKRSLWTALETSTYTKHVSNLLLFPAALGLAMFLGRASASIQVIYPVAEVDPEIVLLARYGDVLVLGKISPGGNRLDSALILSPVGEGPYNRFRPTRLGRLGPTTAATADEAPAAPLIDPASKDPAEPSPSENKSEP